MAHARKQIRDAFVAALTGLPTAGARVEASRVFPVASPFLPTILIYTIEETSQASGMDRPQPLQRLLTVAVECAAEAADVDDVLDAMAAEIETAIGADETLGGLVLDVTLLRTQIGLESPGRARSGRARLDFGVLYRTRSANPHTII
jgi:hypothetical protein